MKLITLFTAFFLVQSISFAKITVEIKTATSLTNQDNFEEDSLVLTVKENAEIKDSINFHSSYGKSSYEIITNKNNTYIFLRFGKGRGTNVRTEFIKIFKVGQFLNHIITFPVSGPAGPSSNWKYTYKATKLKSKGLEILLKRTLSGDSPEYYPEDKTRKITI